MPKQSDKSPLDQKPDRYQWRIRPEPSATPRNRLWLAVSVTTLLVWLAVLIWLAYR